MSIARIAESRARVPPVSWLYTRRRVGTMIPSNARYCDG
jgi:hypothetical protein